MLYLAIDQHARHLTISVRDESGDVVWRRQVSTYPERVRGFLEDLGTRSDAQGGYMAIVEVCGFNDWLIKLLRELGCAEIVLVQPEKRGKQKTDRRDANQLGELLWINRERLRKGRRIQGLRRVHIASEQDYEDRRLTASRQRIGREFNRTLCRIKHMLRRHNLQHDCPTKGIKTNQARRWLETLELPKLDRIELDHLLNQWALLEEYCANLNQCIADREREHDTAPLLRTIPGVAAYSALTLASRVGPIERFPRPASLANFWGLTPSVNDSGQATGRLGSITKRGSATARFILGQVTVHVLHRDPKMNAWYRKIKKRRGSKTARVAVMRRITTIIWHMLSTGEPYQVHRA